MKSSMREYASRYIEVLIVHNMETGSKYIQTELTKANVNKNSNCYLISLHVGVLLCVLSIESLRQPNDLVGWLFLIAFARVMSSVSYYYWEYLIVLNCFIDSILTIVLLHYF